MSKRRKAQRRQSPGVRLGGHELRTTALQFIKVTDELKARLQAAELSGESPGFSAAECGILAEAIDLLQYAWLPEYSQSDGSR